MRRNSSSTVYSRSWSNSVPPPRPGADRRPISRMPGPVDPQLGLLLRPERGVDPQHPRHPQPALTGGQPPRAVDPQHDLGGRELPPPPGTDGGAAGGPSAGREDHPGPAGGRAERGRQLVGQGEAQQTTGVRVAHGPAAPRPRPPGGRHPAGPARRGSSPAAPPGPSRRRPRPTTPRRPPTGPPPATAQPAPPATPPPPPPPAARWGRASRPAGPTPNTPRSCPLRGVIARIESGITGGRAPRPGPRPARRRR